MIFVTLSNLFLSLKGGVMNVRKFVSVGSALLAAMLVSSNALCHSIFVDRHGEKFEVVYGGHGHHTEKYDPSKVKSIKAFRSDGSSISINQSNDGHGVNFGANETPAAATVEFDNGYWVEKNGNWIEGTKQNFKNITGADHAIKETKAIFKWSDAMSKPLGLTLEIVPLSNPAETKGGDPFKLKVLWNGKPKSGVDVVLYNKQKFVTDDNGVVSVPLSKGKPIVAEAELSIPLANDPNADNLYYSSTMTIDAAR